MNHKSVVSAKQLGYNDVKNAWNISYQAKQITIIVKRINTLISIIS